MVNSINASDGPTHRVRVWDLPTRLFHWGLAAAVTGALVTGYLGGNWMVWHMRCGYAALALAVFRLVWGVAGGAHARFADFVRGPAAVWDYGRALIRGGAPRHLGHNPMGGWSVLAMLAAVLLQAVTGLFATDDIFIEGPLYPWVSGAAATLLTRIHRINQEVLIGLIALHLAAVFFYLIVKRDNLIGPMITGDKAWHAPVPPPGGRLWLAAVVALLSGGGVYLLVR